MQKAVKILNPRESSPYRRLKGDPMGNTGRGVAVLLGLSALALACGGGVQTEEAEASLDVDVRVPYLGQEPPGNEPVLFAPGVVSTPTGEWSMAATPDGLAMGTTLRINALFGMFPLFA
jgi:hypothetical protein